VEGDRAPETDEEPVKIVPIWQQESIETLCLLERYEEQEDDRNSEILRRLARIEITIRGRMLSSLQQAVVNSYLKLLGRARIQHHRAHCPDYPIGLGSILAPMTH
jgi:hypothetical protein